ncbi:hypothetical protein VTK73DRAFT_4515 [Phialemonium thermophilum]|uniref:Zn(2)-C6 fungal-type domain-containing protein n=1 Tax=Phialemonium thermophilum TaxID=223376 RepID=A0ABR3WTP2_9PEZI
MSLSPAATTATPTTTTTSFVQPSRRSQSRSVWGCLTCRRRKVKCRSRVTPCDSCRRLRIPCTPSFSSNFKEWRCHQSSRPFSVTVQDAASERTSYPGKDPMSPASQPTTESPPALVASPPSSTSFVVSTQDFLDVGQSSGGWIPTSSSVDPVAAFFLDDFASCLSPTSSSSPNQAIQDESRVEYAPSSHTTTDMCRLASSGDVLRHTLGADLGVGFDDTHLPGEAMFRDYFAISPSISSLSSLLDHDRTLVDYYKRHLSSFFSVKTSTSTSWNFYSYAIQSAERQLDSPLRHGILAWTSAHLILKNQESSEDSRYHHYARARSALDELLAELASDAESLSRSRQAMSTRLNMILSATLFLGYSNVVSGDNDALVSSLTGVTRILQARWEQLRDALGPLESRILVWLAYLDVRASLWTMGRRDCRGERGGLFHFLRSQKGFSSLRSDTGGRYYLTECFGSSYPERELKDDLLQEPAKLLSDEAMSIVSDILRFEDWDDKVGSRGLEDRALIEELRWAKIQAIRSNIARVRAECKVIHADLMRSSDDADHITRTEFHCLTTTALYLSATVLLNRIVFPESRTDEEAQAAAREIVHVARRLRKLGFLCPPRSLVWPIPIFIAGIEVTDEVYQDWILDHMRELVRWGVSASGACDLLRRVIETQESEGRRVKVQDVMEGLAYPSRVLV